MAKCIYRDDMPQAQRDKIAQANTGKHLTDATRAKISAALCDYWAKLPHKPANLTTSGGTTPTPPPLPTTGQPTPPNRNPYAPQ